jgi:hypothetical protein
MVAVFGEEDGAFISRGFAEARSYPALSIPMA